MWVPSDSSPTLPTHLGSRSLSSLSPTHAIPPPPIPRLSPPCAGPSSPTSSPSSRRDVACAAAARVKRKEVRRCPVRRRSRLIQRHLCSIRHRPWSIRCARRGVAGDHGSAASPRLRRSATGDRGGATRPWLRQCAWREELKHRSVTRLSSLLPPLLNLAWIRWNGSIRSICAPLPSLGAAQQRAASLDEAEELDSAATSWTKLLLE